MKYSKQQSSQEKCTVQWFVTEQSFVELPTGMPLQNMSNWAESLLVSCPVIPLFFLPRVSYCVDLCPYILVCSVFELYQWDHVYSSYLFFFCITMIFTHVTVCISMFALLYSDPLNEYTTIYPFHCWWTFGLGCSQFLAVMNKASVNMLIQISWCTSARISLGYIPRSGIARPEVWTYLALEDTTKQVYCFHSLQLARVVHSVVGF